MKMNEKKNLFSTKENENFKYLGYLAFENLFSLSEKLKY